jgi:hypothetical protein
MSPSCPQSSARTGFVFPRSISAEAIALILTVLVALVSGAQPIDRPPAHSAGKFSGTKITESGKHECKATN